MLITLNLLKIESDSYVSHFLNGACMFHEPLLSLQSSFNKIHLSTTLRVRPCITPSEFSVVRVQRSSAVVHIDENEPV